MARLKIATFNINGIRARLDALLAWLERERPDVACLQELKAPDEAFPRSQIEALGYGVLHHGQKSWNGVAILARGAAPIERRRGLPGDADQGQSRYLEADVHGLRVACLYLPNGNPWPGPKFDYKLDWMAALQRHAKALLKAGVPTVMCGDFNVVPTDELDIYNAASWRKDALLQPESREAWFALLAQGWTDSLRAVHGDARIYTFWDYFRKHWERDAGLRIDHLLLDPGLAPLLRDAGVDRWVRGEPGASDHAPTWVVLDTDGAGHRSGAATATTSRSGGAPTALKRGNAKTPVSKRARAEGSDEARGASGERRSATTSKRTSAVTDGGGTTSAQAPRTSGTLGRRSPGAAVRVASTGPRKPARTTSSKNAITESHSAPRKATGVTNVGNTPSRTAAKTGARKAVATAGAADARAATTRATKRASRPRVAKTPQKR